MLRANSDQKHLGTAKSDTQQDSASRNDRNFEPPDVSGGTLVAYAQSSASNASNAAGSPGVFGATLQHTVSASLHAVTKDDVRTFLNYIVAGQQDEAEAMLKKNVAVALAVGDVTDHAGRTFKSITGFQYAVWALDWHLWTMLLNYVPLGAVREQVKGFDNGAWVGQHGKHADWKNLLEAFQTYIDKFYAWDWNQRNKHWAEQVGGAQFSLPMHVLQEYCNPIRPFEPCPDFASPYMLTRSLPDWLFRRLKTGKFDFGLYRYGYMEGALGSREGCIPEEMLSERSALVKLYDARIQQRDQLVEELMLEVLLGGYVAPTDAAGRGEEEVRARPLLFKPVVLNHLVADYVYTKHYQKLAGSGLSNK